MIEDNISRNVTLTWEVQNNATSYILEVAKDINFSNTELSISTSTNSFFLENLDFAEEYFWRVKPSNICDSGVFSEIKSFNTTFRLHNYLCWQFFVWRGCQMGWEKILRYIASSSFNMSSFCAMWSLS